MVFKKILPWILGIAAVCCFAQEDNGDVGYGATGYGDTGYETIGYPEEAPAADSNAGVLGGLPSLGGIGKIGGLFSSESNSQPGTVSNSNEGFSKKSVVLVGVGGLPLYPANNQTRLWYADAFLGWQKEFMDGVFTPVFEASVDATYYKGSAKFSTIFWGSEEYEFAFYDVIVSASLFGRVNVSGFFADAGIQVGYGIGKAEENAEYLNENCYFKGCDMNPKRAVVAIPLGLGYKLSKYVLGARYSFFINHIWDDFDIHMMKLSLFMGF